MNKGTRPSPLSSPLINFLNNSCSLVPPFVPAWKWPELDILYHKNLAWVLLFVTESSTQGSVGWKQRNCSLFQPTLSPHPNLLTLSQFLPFPTLTLSEPTKSKLSSLTWNHASPHGNIIIFIIPGTSLTPGHHLYYLSYLLNTGTTVITHLHIIIILLTLPLKNLATIPPPPSAPNTPILVMCIVPLKIALNTLFNY